jgi:hypothetical protein
MLIVHSFGSILHAAQTVSSDPSPAFPAQATIPRPLSASASTSASEAVSVSVIASISATAGVSAVASLPAIAVENAAPPAFTLMSYHFVPYVNSELVFSPGGFSDGGDSYSNDGPGLSYGFGSNNVSSFDTALTYQRQETNLSRDLSVSIPLSANLFLDSNSSQSYSAASGAIPETWGSSGSSNNNYGASIVPKYSETWYRNGLQFGLQANLNLNGEFTESDQNGASWSPGQSNFSYATTWHQGSTDASGHIEARFGTGRRIDTRWAWNALETVQVLKDHGVLLRPLGGDEFQELSALLARLGSEYSWDFREQRLHDTRVLRDFLTALGCVAPDNPDATVILSDTYLLWNSARLRGGDFVALAEIDDQANLLAGYNVDPFNSPYGTANYFQKWAGDPAPGVGIQCDWSRPLDRRWQFDASERLDYRPYQDESVDGERETAFQGFLNAGSLDLGFFPSERLEVILSDSITASSSQVQNWSALTGGNLMDSYDSSNFQNTIALTLNCQFTYAFSMSLSAGLISSLQTQWGSVLTGPGATAGSPYEANSNYNLNFSVSYRLF